MNTYEDINKWLILNSLSLAMGVQTVLDIKNLMPHVHTIHMFTFNSKR